MAERDRTREPVERPVVSQGCPSVADREFEDYFDAVWPRAQALGLRMGLSREEAEDIALDALAVVYDRWTKVRELTYRQEWGLKVTSNMVLRRFRRRRIPGIPGRVWQRAVEDEATDRRAVGDAVMRLTRRQRQVVILRYLADMPEAEVARALGLDVGTVKQHASRARLALRHTLTVIEEGDADGH